MVQQIERLPSAPLASSPSASSQRGFTLVEVIVAMLICVVGLVAMAGLLAVTLRMQQLGRNSTSAVRMAQDKIDEAEALMEQRRQELSAMGVTLRKLNQAYFAFVNLYAGEAGQPAATNPIGPKVDELRRRAGSLERFVRIIGGVTSAEELDRELERLGSS